MEQFEQGVRENLELTIRLPSADEMGKRVLDEFVTYPACQHLTLANYIWDEDEDKWIAPPEAAVCSVNNDDGLRIR